MSMIATLALNSFVFIPEISRQLIIYNGLDANEPEKAEAVLNDFDKVFGIFYDRDTLIVTTKMEIPTAILHYTVSQRQAYRPYRNRPFRRSFLGGL